MLNAGIMDEEEFNKIIGSKNITVIDFSAVWCGPCRMMAPIVEHSADIHKGEYNYYQVDIDSAENIAVRHEISVVPTIVVFKGGKELGRTSGCTDLETFENFLSETVKSAK